MISHTLWAASSKRKNTIMICDVHAHYISKNFSDLMGDGFPSRVGVRVKAGIAKHPVSDSAGDIVGRLEFRHHNAQALFGFPH